MKHQISLNVGPRVFRVGSDWRAPIAALEGLYRDYPQPAKSVPDFTVRLEATAWHRRLIRPQITIAGDYTLPDAAPVSLDHGLIAAEMAMNLQMALGERRFLILHAASVEKDGKALIITGESGAGKSTLSAILSANGWRFMGDEFVLIDPVGGMAHAFPRPISLKNEAINVVQKLLPNAHYGPIQAGTAKGDIRHLAPNVAAIGAMHETAKPALILFPRFGSSEDVREMGTGEIFVRLTQASTNYTVLGEGGYDALTRLVTTVPTRALDYPDTKTALSVVSRLWAELA